MPNVESLTTSGLVRDSEFGFASGFGIRNSDLYVPYTLGKKVKQRSALPPSECVSIGLALSSALAHLHKHGLVHRDVKPSNIIFIGGVPKLADIGLVAETTHARTYVGTEGLIPPEGPGTAQADIYGLGKVLYEISTGLDRRDFPALPEDISVREARDDTRSANSALRTPHSALDESAFLELNAVVVKACKVEPHERYPSAEEMHADLALLERGLSVKRHRLAQRRFALAWKAGLTAIAVVLLLAVMWQLSDHFSLIKLPRSSRLASSASSVPLGIKSIAVLPFDNESPDSSDDYLGDEVAEEVAELLRTIPELRVIGRESAREMVQKPKEQMTRLARRLQSGAFLQGTIRKTGKPG